MNGHKHSEQNKHKNRKKHSENHRNNNKNTNNNKINKIDQTDDENGNNDVSNSQTNGLIRKSSSMSSPPSLKTVGLVMLIAKRMWKSAASPVKEKRINDPQRQQQQQEQIQQQQQQQHQQLQYKASKPTIISWLASCVIAFTLAFTYLYGVLCAARQSVLWEFGLIFVLPVLGYVFLYDPKNDPVSHTRQQELILYETTFLILTCLSKVSIKFFDSYGDETLNLLFIVFFCFQTRGFYKMEIGMRQWWGFLRSTTLFWSIFVQRYSISQHNPNSVHNPEAVWIHNSIDKDGRFLIWGEDAPTMVILNYFWWLLGVLFVDYYEFLPWSMLHSFHMASFFISASSGEFWHARLLTACHLFILDAVAYFKHGATLGSSEFARMPDSVVNLASTYLVPFFNILSTIGCLSCVLITIACGQDNFYCIAIPHDIWPTI